MWIPDANYLHVYINMMEPIGGLIQIGKLNSQLVFAQSPLQKSQSTIPLAGVDERMAPVL